MRITEFQNQVQKQHKIRTWKENTWTWKENNMIKTQKHKEIEAQKDLLMLLFQFPFNKGVTSKIKM